MPSKGEDVNMKEKETKQQIFEKMSKDVVKRTMEIRRQKQLRQIDIPTINPNIAAGYISQLESGNRKVSIDYLLALGSLGVDLNYVIMGQGGKEETLDEMREYLVRWIMKADAKELAYVKSMIEKLQILLGKEDEQ